MHSFPVKSNLHCLGSVDRSICRQKSGCMERSTEQHPNPASSQLNGIGKKNRDHSTIILAKQLFDKNIPLKKKVCFHMRFS